MANPGSGFACWYWIRTTFAPDNYAKFNSQFTGEDGGSGVEQLNDDNNSNNH